MWLSFQRGYYSDSEENKEQKSDEDDFLQSLNKNESLDLTGEEISTEEVVKLCEALKSNTSLTSLNLSFHRLGNEGVIKLCEALKTNTSLTELTLNDTDIDNEGVIKLSEALKSNPSLISLDLSEIVIGNDGLIKLSEALKSNTSLALLALRDNYIGKIDSEGVITFCETLKSNSSLTSLDLSYNCIDDEVGPTLGELLRSNKSLVGLNITSNNMPDEMQLQLEIYAQQNMQMWVEIHDCIRTNDLEHLKTLLSQHTINLNSFNLSTEGDTILHSAARSNDAKMIEFILQRISPSTKQRMLKAKNIKSQLPIDLLPRWTPSLHSLYPLKFRQVVKAVLMLGAKRQDGTPYYPQTHFYKLPKDLLYLILQYAAVKTK